MSVLSICNTCNTCTIDLFFAFNDLVNKVTELACSIFDLINTSLSSSKEFLAKGIKACKGITGLGGVISLGSTLYEFSTKEFWHNSSWMKITSYSTFIVQKISSITTFLAEMQVLPLTKSLKPIGLIGTIFGMASSIFDLADQSTVIHKSKAKVERITAQHLRFWEDLKGSQNKEDVINRRLEAQQLINQNRARENQELPFSLETRRQTRRATYETLKTKTPQEVATFCNQKIEWLKIKLDNEKSARTKAWIMIALDVGSIALAVLSLALPVPTGLLLLLSIGALTVITNSVDIIGFVMGKILKEKKVKRPQLPSPG